MQKSNREKPKKLLSWQEGNDVLKDIFFSDLGMEESVVSQDWELRYICGTTEYALHSELRIKAIKSVYGTLGSGAYRKLCEDPAWNGLRGVSVESETFCRGHRPSEFVPSSHICDRSPQSNHVGKTPYPDSCLLENTQPSKPGSNGFY